MTTIAACHYRGGGDRYIPYRYRSHFQFAHHRLTSPPHPVYTFEHKDVSSAYYRLLSAVFESSEPERVLVYSSKHDDKTHQDTSLPSGLSFELIDSCSNDWLLRRRRQLPTCAESVRDLPGFADDFYSHLLDWGRNDKIIVAIGNEVYMWDYREKNAGTAQGIIHTRGGDSMCEITGLMWKPSCDKVIVSWNDGDVILWDTEKGKLVRVFLDSGKSHIGSLVWLDNNTFVSGSRSGNLSVVDVREPRGVAACDCGAWVCGLRVSPDGRYLAVGRDNGEVQIWDTRLGKEPKTTLRAHTAGVRAVAFCPWQQSVITTGGGSSDGHIRQWNFHTSKILFEIDCKSQVCEIVWSSSVREMASSHGVLGEEGNNIELWSLVTAPIHSLVHIGTFSGHRARPMHLSLGIDNVTLASASGDESLRLWKAFTKRENKTKSRSSLDLFTSIR